MKILGGRIRDNLAAALLASTALSMSAPAQAQSVKVDIPAQSAADAITKLAQQTGTQILFDHAQLSGVRSNPINGNMTVNQALKAILRGSNFEASASPSGVLVVRPTKLAAGTATAADEVTSSGGDDMSGEVIVVTAQRRAERAIDVPISIVALPDAELKKRNLNGIDDLSAVVPGLTVQSNGAFQRRIILRGLSNLTGSSSLIGLYLDEASVTAAPAAQLDLRTYDLQRVEVLRGPQGTLYGEGSVGGTIRFITNDPQLDAFGLNADVAATLTQDGSPSQRIEGVLNIPLVEGELGVRVAGVFDHQGGWVEQPIAGRNNFNDQRLVNLRAKALWQPTTNLTISAMAIVHRNNAPLANGEDDKGDFEQTFYSSVTPEARDEYELYNLTAAYDFEGVRFLSASTIIDSEKNATYSFRIPLDVTGIPYFGALVIDSPRTAHTFTQEGRLNSTGNGPLQWTVGGIYRRTKDDVGLPEFYFDVVGSTPAPLPAPLSAPLDTFHSRSWAAFGDVSYEFLRRLKLGVGLRYFEDRRRAVSGPPGPIVYDVTGKFKAWTPRFYAQYKLADHANIYASASKGFRSGGFNPLNGSDFQPENVWTYEVGTKVATRDNLLGFEIAVFHSDYKNYQINGVPPPPEAPFGRVLNAGDARIRGIEWSARLRPLPGWILGVDGAYLNTVFRRIDATNTAYLAGDNLDVVPKYTFTASVEREFKWNDKPGYVRTEYTQTGRSTYRNRTFGPSYFSRSDVINALSMSVHIQWSDTVSFGLFAENLLNDRGLIDPFEIENYATRKRPRTLGARAAFSF